MESSGDPAFKLTFLYQNNFLHPSNYSRKTMSTPISSQQNPTARNNKNSTNEADIIFNRANVALARSQRLVASWLSPAAGADEKVEKTESEQAELQRLEDEMFTPVPERYALPFNHTWPKGKKKRVFVDAVLCTDLA